MSLNRRLGVDPGALGRWERGENRPSPKSDLDIPIRFSCLDLALLQFGDPLVLIGDLGFQTLDLAAQRSSGVGLTLKGDSAFLEKLPLPPVEDRRLEIILVT